MDETITRTRVSGDYASWLAESGLVNKEQALKALHDASQNKQSYIEYLVTQKIFDPAQIAKATSEYFGLPLCDINAIEPDPVSDEFLNIPLVKQRLALPLFKKYNLLYIGIADPTLPHLDEVRFMTGHDIRLLVVEADKLSALISEKLNEQIFSEISHVDVDISLKKIEISSETSEKAGDLASVDVESAPIINYVNKVLLDAIEKNASDIHFECYEDGYRIRFRQHGILYPISSPPSRLANYILARIKVMSNLDITEHRLPQDGRFKLIISNRRSVDFRVSVCPTVYGEKAVLRILDTSRIFQDIKNLGMDPIQESHFVNALQRSQGMILVTGPTGSGKTVTLYSGLRYLNSPEKNISTVEDPVEIPVSGINQVNIQLKTGLNFSTVLRSFLRQDPDIIMVGEIRDLETAEIAIKASQTGHLVLSTLHTNSAPETVNRLINMGIVSYNLASSLSIVIAQRLIRVLCDVCRKRDPIPPEVLIHEGFTEEEAKTAEIYTAKGCEQCVQGYRGRIGIFEVMPITSAMAELIMRGGNAIEIATLAKNEGVTTLREAGLACVKQGLTSLVELNRVFKQEK